MNMEDVEPKLLNRSRKMNKNVMYLYDGRGTYELSIKIPCEERCAASKKRTVVVYEVHTHLSQKAADALVARLKGSGAEIEYGERP